MEHDLDNTRSYVPISAGTKVSHYRIVEKIGAGGMGVVYLAEDGNLGRKVALKFLPAHLTADEEVKSRFAREARTAAKLNHPNIVSIHEVGEFKDRPYFVMELVEGESLSTIARRKQLPLDRILNYAMQICSGLEEAHRAGIIHRDIKPANILIDKQNRIRLLDFGLATVAGDERLTLTGSTLGTLSYMSPEQLQGGSLGPQSDIFALGIILYELTCGIHPFAESSSAEAAARILRDEPANVRSRRPDVPYDLARIIGRCLKKDPARRFQSAKDISNELLDLRELMGSGSVDVGHAPTRQKRQKDPQEKKFVLTADLVRKLQVKSPEMVGDRLIYLDNNVESDMLVIYMNGGIDHRHVREFLESLQCRGISPTLYGYDLRSPNRLPLTLEDHSVLFRALFSEINDRIKPKHVILMGFSSGADHALHLATSEIDPGIKLSGLLAFGCNINLESCFLTSKFANLKHGNPEELLEGIKEISNSTRTLGEWLKFNEYLVEIFSKFDVNADPLQSYGEGIVEPFRKNDWKQFAYWYRTATERIPNVRFILDIDDTERINAVLARHLESNVLGDGFREESIVRENIAHIHLSNPQTLLKYTGEMIEQITSSG